MPSNFTANYQLSQWEATDKVQRTDFNADNAKIDAAIKAVEVKADALTGGKADASTVTTLSQTVSGHTATLGKKGNCQIYYTTYVGSGQAGPNYPTSLTFPGKPLAVFISTSAEIGFLILLRDSDGVTVNSDNFRVPATWGSNYVQWYSNDSSRMQYSQYGITYHVVALLTMD